MKEIQTNFTLADTLGSTLFDTIDYKKARTYVYAFWDQLFIVTKFFFKLSIHYFYLHE